MARLHRRYHVLRLLGRGGMGTVYSAWDRLTSREVALKRLLIHLPPAGSSGAGSSGAPSRLTPEGEPTGDGNAPSASAKSTAAAGAGPASYSTVLGAGAGSSSALSALTEDIVTNLGAAAKESALAPIMLGDPSLPSTIGLSALPLPAPGPGSDADSLVKTKDYYGRRAALASEFRTLATLHHPNVVSVLDYGFDEAGQPYYAMELLQGDRTILVAGAGRPYRERAALMAQLLRALAYLHRHGIVHRDIKPGNILCIQDTIKVTDFGIAAPTGHKQRLAGTVQYMAPELLLGAPPTVASDLYAVGVIAHELLTGCFPFNVTSMDAFLEGVLGPRDGELPQRAREFLGMATPASRPPPGTPRLSRLVTRSREELPAIAELPSQLGEVVFRLLARDPADRYTTAEEVLEALGDVWSGELEIETAATRESFLQSAPLVGRKEEFERLTALLDGAMLGRGALILVGGESGVGKSRLLEELRVLAMVRGVMVLRGQARSSASAPFEMFIDVLRELAAYLDLDDREAGILATMIHDLPLILERTLSEPPEVDGRTAERRLLSAIETLLLRWQGPLLIELEDLHWADPSSLALLRRLSYLVPSKPLLIVCSYRDDENPTLPAALPGAQVLLLSRMSQAATAELCIAMLGEAARMPQLLELIQRDTEGNALFVVEAVRALAEEAGSLGAVGTQVLPTELLTGSIRSILRRRLTRVPAWAESTLYLLAIAGREIDPRLLRELEPDPDTWLEACASASVLTVCEGRWRFAHDKLRETLLATLSQDEHHALHLQVAMLIERTTPSANAIAAILAYHYGAANLPERAAHFAGLAGEQALAAGALTEAARLLSEAMAHQERVPDAYPQHGLLRAHTLRLLASAYAGLGRYGDCIAMVEKTLLALSRPLPREAVALGSALLEAASREVQSRFLGQRRSSPHSPEALREFLRLWLACGETFLSTGNGGRALLGALWALEAAELLGDLSAQANYNATIAYVIDLFGLPLLGDGYLRRAEELLERSQDPAAELRFHRLLGIWQMNRGQYAVAVRTHASCAALAERLGDEYAALFCHNIQIGLHFTWAAHSRAEELLVTLLTAAEQKGAVRFVRAAWLTQAALWLRRGQPEAAQRALDSVGALDEADAMSQLQRSALLSRLHLIAGRPTLAYDTVAQSWRRHATLQVGGLGLLESTYGLLDVCLTLVEKGQAPADAAARELCRDMVRTFMSRRRRFRHWEPRALVCAGRLAWLDGNPGEALHLFQAALPLAQNFALPYDEALIHAYLGLLGARRGHLPTMAGAARRRGGGSWPPPRLHLRAAANLLRSLDIVGELEWVSAELAALDTGRQVVVSEERRS